MAKKISGIYIIVNTKNGKVYIGQAQDIKKRWRDHRGDLRRGKHKNSHLQKTWNKYGEKIFLFQILEHCPVEQLDQREQHHLDIYMAKGTCYNIARDVRMPTRGISPSIETRRKISEAKQNLSDETRHKLSEAQKNRPPMSDETRQKISEKGKGNKSNLGKHPSAETRSKLSEAQKNRPPMSDETRQKISEAKKGKKHSEEARRKMSEAKQNMSDETRRKIGEANKQRLPASAETRLKISEAVKRRHALKKQTEPPNTDESTE